MFERNRPSSEQSREDKPGMRIPDAYSVVVDVNTRGAANDEKIEQPRPDIAQLSDDDIRSSFPPVSPEIREAGERLRERVRVAKSKNGFIQEEQTVVGESGIPQEKVTSLARHTGDTSRVASQEQQSESHQAVPLSSQALRFEIQTREEQLRVLQDQDERKRILSQLQAYRGLLLESEQQNAAGSAELASQRVSLRAVSSKFWKKVTGWFSW